jgi:hypothetical protein
MATGTLGPDGRNLGEMVVARNRAARDKEPSPWS